MAKNNFEKVIHCMAFFGLAIIAVVLVLQMIFNNNGSLIVALRTIGEAIAYSITAIYGFFYVKSKRNIWWYLAYVIALVLVVVFMILR